MLANRFDFLVNCLSFSTDLARSWGRSVWYVSFVLFPYTGSVARKQCFVAFLQAFVDYFCPSSLQTVKTELSYSDVRYDNPGDAISFVSLTLFVFLFLVLHFLLFFFPSLLLYYHIPLESFL